MELNGNSAFVKLLFFFSFYVLLIPKKKKKLMRFLSIIPSHFISIRERLFVCQLLIDPRLAPYAGVPLRLKPFRNCFQKLSSARSLKRNGMAPARINLDSCIIKTENSLIQWTADYPDEEREKQSRPGILNEVTNDNKTVAIHFRSKLKIYIQRVYSIFRW